MLKEDYTEAGKVKKPFKFTYTRPSLDWYEDVNVSIAYDEYDYLALESRYGGSWWVIGKKYIEDKEKWVSKQVGEIKESDIPRLVEWAEYTNRFGHQVSILNEIRTIDGCLNPIREFLRIMSRYGAESEGRKMKCIDCINNGVCCRWEDKKKGGCGLTDVRWIPVSERLPESDGVYIVSRWFSDGEESAILTDANYYDGCGEWYNDNRISWDRKLVTNKIVAWMPLPEPYKEG